MRKIKSRAADNCFVEDGNGLDQARPYAPFQAEGRQYVPADDFKFATTETRTGEAQGLLMISLGGVGLHYSVSANTLREMGHRMIDAAKRIEDNAASLAAAALSRASKRRGGGMTRLRAIWQTDSWNPETRQAALISRQGLQALMLFTPFIATLGLVLGLGR